MKRFFYYGLSCFIFSAMVFGCASTKVYDPAVPENRRSTIVIKFKGGPLGFIRITEFDGQSVEGWGSSPLDGTTTVIIPAGRHTLVLEEQRTSSVTQPGGKVAVETTARGTRTVAVDFIAGRTYQLTSLSSFRGTTADAISKELQGKWYALIDDEKQAGDWIEFGSDRMRGAGAFEFFDEDYVSTRDDKIIVAGEAALVWSINGDILSLRFVDDAEDDLLIFKK
jgi:hypothetical protein